MGKEENAGNQHFLVFPQCFLSYEKTTLTFSVTFYLSSANAFNLGKPKNLSSGKRLTMAKGMHVGGNTQRLVHALDFQRNSKSTKGA